MEECACYIYKKRNEMNRKEECKQRKIMSETTYVKTVILMDTHFFKERSTLIYCIYTNGIHIVFSTMTETS